MSKFLGLSGKGNMMKIEDASDKKGYVWYFLAQNVMGFAKTLQMGADIEIKVEEKNGEDTITYITTGGSKTNNTVSTASATADNGFKCEVCGVTLKDNKYKKCYTCSLEAKKHLETHVNISGDNENKSRQTSIEKQAMMKSAANAVATAMQGQVDLNTLGEQICSLYDKLLAKLLE